MVSVCSYSRLFIGKIRFRNSEGNGGGSTTFLANQTKYYQLAFKLIGPKRHKRGGGHVVNREVSKCGDNKA